MVNLKKYLQAKKHPELFDCFSNLLQNDSLDQDLLQFNLKALKHQIDLNSKPYVPHFNLSPFKEGIRVGNIKLIEEGKKALERGLCGCILLAGGQGTRLGWDGPKGTFPISLIRKKSLFQLFAEKVKAASKLFKRDLPLAIMTSPLNEALTKQYFEKHNFFHLNPDQVFFFSQSMLPLLDESMKLFYSKPNEIAEGPDGNGSLFSCFVNQKIHEKWETLNIKYVNTVLIDNPLADPFDFESFGLLIHSKSDVVLKSCLRKNKQEKVGVILNKKGKPVVVEYHEIPCDLEFKKEPLANLSLCSFNMNFLAASSSLELPLHRVLKESTVYDMRKKQYLENKQKIWKFEKYLFDVLPYSKKTSVLVYPRDQIFSPLKQKTGEDSVESVQRDIFKKEQKIYEKVSLLKAPKAPFELDSQFYYPTEDFLKKWKKKKPSSAYLL